MLISGSTSTNEAPFVSRVGVVSVYVDDMYRFPIGRFGRMKMSHMTADTTEELRAMAAEIGVAQRWLQSSGEWKEHFDISMSKRAEAVKAGALEITMRESAVAARSRWESRQ